MNFYRTAKGTKRHADWACANYRRSIHLGPVVTIPEAEVADWAPCAKCAEGVAVPAAAPAEAKPEACRNSGVRHPRRVESECRDCGKRGKVDRRTGKLRGHAPAA
ncbi:hypothetical protein ACFWDN_21405 [Micromonospora chalcea]